MRDDFTEETKRITAQRVGYRCSNPTCRTLTVGPQESDSKALSVGVAAHICAAAPGGPRYDPEMLPEERTSPANAIWVCHSCSRLVDGDVARFSVNVLRRWKLDAEHQARSRIGKTQAGGTDVSSRLAKWTKVRIEPAVPRRAERETWTVTDLDGESAMMRKDNSSATISIPRTLIAAVHRFEGDGYSLVQLSGRLQWLTTKQRWELLSQKPPPHQEGQYGVPRDVDFSYPMRSGIVEKFGLHWFREERVPKFLDQGWNVFYDDDGSYLRVPGPDADQVLLSKTP